MHALAAHAVQNRQIQKEHLGRRERHLGRREEEAGGWQERHLSLSSNLDSVTAAGSPEAALLDGRLERRARAFVG